MARGRNDYTDTITGNMTNEVALPRTVQLAIEAEIRNQIENNGREFRHLLEPKGYTARLATLQHVATFQSPRHVCQFFPAEKVIRK